MPSTEASKQILPTTAQNSSPAIAISSAKLPHPFLLIRKVFAFVLAFALAFQQRIFDFVCREIAANSAQDDSAFSAQDDSAFPLRMTVHLGANFRLRKLVCRPLSSIRGFALVIRFSLSQPTLKHAKLRKVNTGG